MKNVNTLPDCLVPIANKKSPWSLCGVFGIGATKAHELVKAPDFPKPVNLGGRCVRYRLSEVLAWAESKRVNAAPIEELGANA